jgi:prepilin-type processing-associated H-X9-DG protein
VHSYAAAHAVYPPGTTDDPGVKQIASWPNGKHYGWMTHILPYIDEAPIYNRVNFTAGIYDLSNNTIRLLSLSQYTCPSDGGAFRGGTSAAATSSYAGMHHHAEAPIAVDNTGMFFLNSRVRLDEVPDGASNTIFLGEHRISGPDLGWASGTRSTLRNAGSNIGVVTILGGGLNNGNQFELTAEQEMMMGVQPLSEDADPMFAPVPLDPVGDAKAPPPPFAFLVGGFGSAHPGGANFAFGDGSVRFLKQTVSPSVYQALANRADGGLVSDNEF